ncbi:hypothetical protein B0189_06100 [Moraxella cuniculi]|nr:hypothetical protein B0189_06100 [Moraxella cuniculi]
MCSLPAPCTVAIYERRFYTIDTICDTIWLDTKPKSHYNGLRFFKLWHKNQQNLPHKAYKVRKILCCLLSALSIQLAGFAIGRKSFAQTK